MSIHFAEIYCDSPYDVNNAEAVYSTTSLGSKVIYECYAGYWFVSGIYVVIATCNSSAEWETENGPGWTLGSNVHCSSKFSEKVYKDLIFLCCSFDFAQF